MFRAEIVQPVGKILEKQVAEMEKLSSSLNEADRTVFEDLVSQCKLYLPQATRIPFTHKEFPTMVAILFAQYRRVTALEKQLIIKGPASLTSSKLGSSESPRDCSG